MIKTKLNSTFSSSIRESTDAISNNDKRDRTVSLSVMDCSMPLKFSTLTSLISKLNCQLGDHCSKQLL